MNQVFKTILLYAGFILFISKVWAAPHNGEAFILTQPDGTRVSVVVWGDEFYQHIETPEGYTLIRDHNTHWICYADVDGAGHLISTGMVYNGESPMLKSALKIPKHIRENKSIVKENAEQNRENLGYYKRFQTADIKSKSTTTSADGIDRYSTGILKGVTILIDFADDPATLPKEEVFDMMNKQGYSGYGNKGSVHDYFHDISNGVLNYTNEVIGYYRAPLPKTYYDNDDLVGYDKVDELLRAILDSATVDFNFATLTQVGGYAIAVNFMYAGNPLTGWGKGLWPHSGFLGKTADNVSIGFYQLSRISDELSIGTFCHESCHSILVLPDLYDYDNDSQGVGDYDLMNTTDPKNPAPLNAFFRDLCGWENTIDISNNKSDVVFRLPANTNQSLVYRHPYINTEFYYIESRVKEGRNATISDEGLMIWHIDFTGNNSFQQGTPKQHYYASLIQADNKFDLERNVNSGDTTDLFKAGGNNSFSMATSPSASWWDGSASYLSISEIGVPGENMSVKVHPSIEPALKPMTNLPALRYGLRYTYIQGTFKIMPDFEGSTFKTLGIVNDITAYLGDKSDKYAVQFEGFIKISNSDEYVFKLNSDDGSLLYLNDRLIINNSNELNGSSQSTTILLSEGYYPFRVEYFQFRYERGLELFWKRPSTGMTQVPAANYYTYTWPVSNSNLITENSSLSYNNQTKQLIVLNSDPLNFDYSVYTIEGKLITNGSVAANTPIELRLDNGIYVISVVNEGGRMTKKIAVSGALRSR